MTDTPKKRPGRPPLAAGAMTPAERSRRYRESRSTTAKKYGRLAGVDDDVAERVSTMALIDTLRDCVTRHDKRNGLRVLRVIGKRLSAIDDLEP